MSQPNGGAAICANCGAPDGGELVMCRFCAQAVSAEAQQSAIPCPNQSCRMLCRWGKQKCGHCQAWLVVSCVFCGSLSPHNISNCMQCNEAFAGAAQRKAAMHQQQQHHQNMQHANVWGRVAAACAGAAVGSAISHRSYHYPSCSSGSSIDSDVGDFSDVSDGGFDFGGFD